MPEAVQFTFGTSAAQEALRTITGTPIREFNLDPASCIDCFRKGRAKLRDMFGPELSLPGLATPAISYGHANALGCELVFPEQGEVGVEPCWDSLDEGFAKLSEPIDFASVGWAPYFLDFREQIKAAFPGESVGLSFGLEGPITTAWEVREMDFFCDLLDDTPRVIEFLARLTDSIVEFGHWLCDVHGRPRVNPSGVGLCDDLSSFVPPKLFNEVVIPAWDRYYSGQTTGNRYLHAENYRPEHVVHLNLAGLARFDPSISPYLNPKILAADLNCPFQWRMGCFHMAAFDLQDIRDFVFQAAADGASGVFTIVAAPTANDEGVVKVDAFRKAGREVQQMFADGASRTEVGEAVSARGKVKFWDDWWH